MADDAASGPRLNIPVSVFEQFANVDRPRTQEVDATPVPPIKVESDTPSNANSEEERALVETNKPKFDWKGTLLWSFVGALASAALTAIISVLATPNLFKSKPKPKKNKNAAEFDANNGTGDVLYAKEKIDWGKIGIAVGIVSATSFGASILLSWIVYEVQKGSNKSNNARLT